MEFIVQEALKFDGLRTEKRSVSTESTTDFEEFGQPKIKVLGCGGAGNNTINRLYAIGADDVEIIAINTDRQHLDMINADKKILVGKSLTRGLGAGGYPEIGQRAAELARATLAEELKDTDLVFITAGMGGGTGTGTAPVVAQIAKEQGAITICMVSTPFKVERARTLRAEEGIAALAAAADTVILLDNNRLLEMVPNLPLEQSFSVMDQLISETVKGISETITRPSLINIDYADIKTIMNAGGVAVLLVGEAKGENKAGSVVKAALDQPLLDVDCRGATGALIHITGGQDLTLHEAEGIASSLTYELDARANVIWGARIQENYEGKVRVLAILTGIKSAQIVGKEAGSVKLPGSPAAVTMKVMDRKGKDVIDHVR